MILNIIKSKKMTYKYITWEFLNDEIKMKDKFQISYLNFNILRYSRDRKLCECESNLLILIIKMR